MACYKEGIYLTTVGGDVFDTDHRPATHAPVAGIYRCTGCGREIAAAAQQPLPAESHHHHSLNKGSVRWRLIVYANQEPH